jgi:hypothetical protein
MLRCRWAVSVVSEKFAVFVWHYLVCRELPEKQVPFDFAQGRLSAPLKYASLRMTSIFLIWTLETGHQELAEKQDSERMVKLRIPSGAKAPY